MKRSFLNFILVLVMCFLLSPVTSFAATNAAEMSRYPNVTLSPDGSERAWTTDLWDKTNERLPMDYVVDMHAESSLEELKAGQHYYDKPAVGSVTIGKWIVSHSPGQCIHDTPVKDTFAGFSYTNGICGAYYNNGWIPYCADCGDAAANILMYAKESTVRQITSIPASSIYVYQCPHCSHLEQGHSYQHYCKEISSNRYRVTYRPNSPEDSLAAGYMAPTMHMNDNSTTYNGEPASELGYTDKALRKNSYSCTGYLFVGWNTKADGSGENFTDGQEVLNLTNEDNGTVKLYAQWKKAEGSLLLDAGGGTYQGKEVYEQKQKYGTSYTIDNGQIVPPAGYKVSFVTNGGSAVNPITTTRSFTHWEIQGDFQGEFKDNVYKYLGDNGNVDKLIARYTNDAFTLPDCTGTNVSLVGWYDDPEMGDDSFIGKPGDQVILNQDTILYAKWAALTLWAYEDYSSHGGVGAVDLEWEQKDGKGKYYRLYQSEDKASWKDIFSASDIQSGVAISKEYGTSDQGTTYTIPYTGNYTLTAYGAKGADYSSSYIGGKGGSVTVTYWLVKGDVITVYPGNAGSGVNGGTNGNGANGGTSSSNLGRGGGAASQIYLTRGGTKTLLITAGGGGGANAGNSGGNGGTGGGASTSAGANGIGAGGGGYSGGLNGVFAYHAHSSACGYHTHSGNSTSGGGCYTNKQTQSVYCGESESYEQGPCSWWWDDVNDRCIRCHSTDPNTKHYGDRCTGCGRDWSGGTHYITKTVYKLGCGLNVGYQCGKTTSTVDSYKASVGGTSYAASGYGAKSVKMTAGKNNGNGKITISSLDIGYLEQTNLKDVLAKDKAAPGAIPWYTETLSGKNTCRITVTEPKDNGTVYYHRVESFDTNSVKKLVDSNVTENTLTSGIAGYRYYVDTKSDGTVTSGHSMTSKNAVDVEMLSYVRYLHIAAVDKAGNIGPTIHISVKASEEAADISPDDTYVEKIGIYTEQLILKDSEFVYPADIGKYYVKADGETEHLLELAGYIDGPVSNHYQIDWIRMISDLDSSEEWYQARIPRTNVQDGDIQFANTQLQADASKESLEYLDPTYATASRINFAQKIRLEQRFTIASQHNGKLIKVYPRAMAEYQKKAYWSDINEDQSHSLVLIPDGEAPVIIGIEALQNAGNIDMTNESKEFVISAEDNGSGLRGLTITITNLDNLMQRTYSSDVGELSITVKRDDYLFMGDFMVSVEASDNVGNTNLVGSDNLAFTLEAEVKRTREPQDGNFKAGDGAMMTIRTAGYVDKVVVRFPDEWNQENPELNKEYVYELPVAIKTEQYEFNIPLSTSSGDYFVEVEAWKNGRLLTEELLLTIETERSITDELRTRIRDNGV